MFQDEHAALKVVGRISSEERTDFEPNISPNQVVALFSTISMMFFILLTFSHQEEIFQADLKVNLYLYSRWKARTSIRRRCRVDHTRTRRREIIGREKKKKFTLNPYWSSSFSSLHVRSKPWNTDDEVQSHVVFFSSSQIRSNNVKRRMSPTDSHRTMSIHWLARQRRTSLKPCSQWHHVLRKFVERRIDVTKARSAGASSRTIEAWVSHLLLFFADIWCSDSIFYFG